VSTGATHPRDLPPCDLVMKGGVTSGVVYPGAMIELSPHYRFARIGGTSAGAVAAAAGAAAEYRRQRSGLMVMEGLEGVVDDLRQPGLFLSVFAPTQAARPLFTLLLRLSRAGKSHRRQSAALARGAIGARPRPALISLGIAAVVLVLLVLGVRKLPIELGVAVAVIGAVVLMLLAASSVVGPLVSIARGVYRSLGEHDFGLCTGTAADPGAPDALTEWLHARIQECAGLGPDEPLTFAMLDEAGISLQMVATDVGLGRPVTLPVGPEQYLFAPKEFRRLFPPVIADHVFRAAGVPESERDSSRTWFLPSGELPIVVGGRLSSSVPILLSSLKLYTAHPDAYAPTVSYISDGAITSNFPIQFFDEWLPTHPTFGLDLVTVAAAAGGRGQPAVFMPGSDDELRPAPTQGIKDLGSFIGRLQDSTRNWRDELQAELPGFRERICQIRLTPDEGGFHLDADSAAVDRLVERGHMAGREILTTFDWDHHRWIRYVTLMTLLRENFGLLAERFEAYRDGLLSPSDPERAMADAELRQAFDRATANLIEHAATLPDAGKLWTSEPAPALRIGPRI
jgi:predicted acylesterase/phospholipase RssA